MTSEVPGQAPCSLPWDEQAQQAAHARAAGHTWSRPGAVAGQELEVRAAPAPEQGFVAAVLCLQCWSCYETGMRWDNAEQFLLPRFCPAAKSQFRGFCGSLACFGLFLLFL